MANYEVWLDKENIYVRNSEGQTASKPISRFKRLMQAIEEQRNAFELSSCGIHWYDLDVDLEFESFFHLQKFTLLACRKEKCLGKISKQHLELIKQSSTRCWQS